MTSGFRRSGEHITRDFAAEEVALLRTLAAGLDETLSAVGADEGDGDAVLERLLPDAYGDDEAEAAAEFADFTRERIAAGKRLRVHELLDSLGDDSDEELRISLDAESAQTWLMALNDMRLALATRIGPERLGDPRLGAMGDVYDWLGWLQAGLLDTHAS